MEQALEPLQQLAVAEHAVADEAAIGTPVVTEDPGAHPLDERVPHPVVDGEEMVDDLVARHRRGAVGAQRREQGRLAGADPARDRDRDRTAGADRR